MSPYKLSLAMCSSLLFVACSGGTFVHAEMPGAGDPPRGVVASGTGEAKAAPDIARTNLGVEVRAATAAEATAQCNARMNAVISALKQAGVAAHDLRTQNFSINFEQEPVPHVIVQPPPDAPVATRSKEKVQDKEKDKAAQAELIAPPRPVVPEIRGFYRVSNMVEVTVRDLSKVGELLQIATNNGANNVWGISFELEHPEALLAQARGQAIEKAKKNAEELAKLAGVKLGRLVSITENGSSGGPMPMMKAMRAEADQSVPIERGEISVSQQVQLVYELPM